MSCPVLFSSSHIIILLPILPHITHELDAAVRNIYLANIIVNSGDKFRMKDVLARILDVKSEMLAELHVRTVQQWKKIIFSLHFKK
jgi:hypothetical protein